MEGQNYELLQLSRFLFYMFENLEVMPIKLIKVNSLFILAHLSIVMLYNGERKSKCLRTVLARGKTQLRLVEEIRLDDMHNFVMIHI